MEEKDYLLSSSFSLKHSFTYIKMAADLPDFMTDANAVLNDKDHEWRYNRVPDYKKVNAAYEEGNNINMTLPLLY